MKLLDLLEDKLILVVEADCNEIRSNPINLGFYETSKNCDNDRKAVGRRFGSKSKYQL